MKFIVRTSILLFIIVATASSGLAQTGTFFEVGVGGSYGSNRPDREKGGPDLYGALGFKIAEFKGSTVQLRARGKLSREAELLDIFTRDNNPERMPTGEFRLHPEVRWNLSTETFFKPFIAAGGEYVRHFGLKGAPYLSFTPTLTFGTKAGYGYEIFYTRLFEDRLNRAVGFPVQTVPGVITTRFESSKLKGDRLGVSYSFKAVGKLRFKAGAEADYVSYRACSNVACDAYREYDWTVRPFIAISIY